MSCAESFPFYGYGHRRCFNNEGASRQRRDKNRILVMSTCLRVGLVLLLVSIFATGCSLLPVRYELPAAGEFDCGEHLAALDADIERYTHFDPALRRIPDQPLLRSNRFVASFASPNLQGDSLRIWLQQMNALAQEGYSTEIQRLPEAVKKQWQNRLPVHGVAGMLSQCSEAFLSQPTVDASLLSEHAQPLSNYSNAQRFWGIYPLTKRLAASSIEDYRAEMTERIHQGERQQFSRSTLYHVDSTPLPAASPELAALLHQHAPVIQVENNSAADQVGAPIWRDDNQIGLETQTPHAYTYVTQVRYKQQVMMQLNYVFWFAARPKLSSFDLYGGDLDALVWRVTLNAQGKPLLYDSIHACGCYHLLFLPQGTVIDISKIKGEQPLSFDLPTPQLASSTSSASPSYRGASSNVAAIRLKVDSGTHYLIDVDMTKANAATAVASNLINQAAEKRRYSLQPYQQLLMLPTPTGYRSLFGDDGIIAQSSRLERFVLWPLGVPNAGAMRQAGTHAIAFIGERHFDDPWLLDQLGISFSEE